MKRISRVVVAVGFVILCACSTQSGFVLVCDDPTVDIYVDGEYIGKSRVSYAFPPGQKQIVVTCMENGEEVYHRTFYKGTHAKNEVVDLVIQKDMRYSTGK